VILLSKFSRSNSNFSRIRVQLNAAHASFVASSAPNRAARRSMINNEKGKLRNLSYLKDERGSDQNILFEDSRDEHYNRYSNDDINNFIGDRSRRHKEIRESGEAENNHDNREEYDDFRSRDYRNDNTSSWMPYDYKSSDNFLKNDGSNRMDYDDIRGRYENDKDDYKCSNDFSKNEGINRMEYDDIRDRYDNVDVDSDTRGYNSIRYSNSDENITRFNDTGYNSNDISDTNRSIRGDQEYSVMKGYDDSRYQEYSDDENNAGCDSPDRGFQGSSSDHISFNDHIDRYQESVMNNTQDEVPFNHPHEGYHGSSSDQESSRDQVVSIAPETLSDKAGRWYAKFANKKIKEETIETPLIEGDEGEDIETVKLQVDMKKGFPTEGYNKKRPNTEIDIPNMQDIDTGEKDSLRGKRLYEEGNHRNSYTDVSNRNRKEHNRYDDRKMEMYYRAEDDTNSRVRDVQSSWNDSRERHGGQGISRYSSSNPSENYCDKNKECDRDRSYRRGASDRMDSRDRDFSYDRQSSSGNVRRGSGESYYRLLFLKLVFLT
jgi:hypothetical protein